MDDKVMTAREPSLEYTNPVPDLVMVRRLMREAEELRDAVRSAQPHYILDEVVDVMYFCKMIAHSFGLTDEMMADYARFKTNQREKFGKDKAFENEVAKAISARNRVKGESV